MSVQPDLRSEETRLRVVRRSMRHDSAPKHVAGSATFIDDIREPEGVLHIAVGGAPVAAGQLLGAISLARTTQDSARIIGALTGAGLFAVLGIGFVYVVISGLYLAAAGLMLCLTRPEKSLRAVPCGDQQQQGDHEDASERANQSFVGICVDDA